MRVQVKFPMVSAELSERAEQSNQPTIHGVELLNHPPHDDDDHEGAKRSFKIFQNWIY